MVMCNMVMIVIPTAAFVNAYCINIYTSDFYIYVTATALA